MFGDQECDIKVDLAVSSEKIELLTELAKTFNDSDAARLGNDTVCAEPHRKASGGGMQALARGWDEAVDGPKPVVWSPASGAWGPVLNQRLADQGKPDMVGEGQPFMLTPLVIAMPEPLAEALGWPDKPLGWADILDLANSDEGWAAFGHPEWGEFRLGKTNPNFSTSGLSALIAQTYAATGKTSGLTTEDVLKASTREFAKGVESSVVHYGDTTLTFLNNWANADARGTAVLYASAAAVEEKSIIDYNRGNPDGVTDPGEVIREPRVPLVAIYPKEGTLYSDNPFFVLDAEWVDDKEREAAALFADFVQQPENQEKVLEFGFRPGNPQVAITAPIDAANGLDPNQPQTLLEVPQAKVMTNLIDQWAETRKEARVLLVIDVSGSMSEYAVGNSGETKLDLARRAAITSLSQFKATDEVGLWIFTTQGGRAANPAISEVVPIGPIGTNGQQLEAAIDGLLPLEGTPLYQAAQESYEAMLADFDADKINAVVLLSDGMNDDGDRNDDPSQLEELLAVARQATEGERSTPVRIFPIAYGSGADITTLQEIAEASNARAYDASDPASIDKVFTAVVSNF